MVEVREESESRFFFGKLPTGVAEICNYQAVLSFV